MYKAAYYILRTVIKIVNVVIIQHVKYNNK